MFLLFNIFNKFIFCLFLFMISCGSDPATTITTEGQTVFITDRQFIPSELNASAGETIFFVNDDATPHIIQSQSAASAFDATGDFESFVIDVDATGFILIPDTAVSGDQFFFYSSILEDTMLTPNGLITIE